MYKVMALDVGTKRIGVALSDFLLMIANGHSCVSRQPENKAIEEILKIAKENHVEKIVVGVPLNMDGTQGFQANDCIRRASACSVFQMTNSGFHAEITLDVPNLVFFSVPYDDGFTATVNGKEIGRASCRERV